MRLQLLGLMSIFFCSSYAQSVDKYFCVEGRTWNYHYEDIFNHADDRDYSLTIKGDAIFKGESCKKLYYTSNGDTLLYAYMQDKGTALYMYFLPNNIPTWNCGESSDWEEIYDFQKKVGDVWLDEGTDAVSLVAAIDTIEVNDKLFIRYTTCHPEEEPTLYNIRCIRGIGTREGLFQNSIRMVTNGKVTSFKSVYDGDECIITWDDFVKPKWETGIGMVLPSSCVKSRIYNLQGQPLQEKPKHGIYISDGKKVITR